MVTAFTFAQQSGRAPVKGQGRLWFLLLCLLTFPAGATDYYVSGTGSDSNNGLSTSTPFRTIQKAADLTQPGDVVYLMNGLYTNSTDRPVVDIRRSGSASAWIVYKPYPGHTPKIKFSGWGGIEVVGASYIELNGLEIEGNNDNVTLQQAETQFSGCTANANPAYNGNGIFINDYSGATANPHYVKVINCKIYKCGGGGIASHGADYLTIENNQVYENAWYSVYANSGISIFQPYTFPDGNTGYRMLVRNNVCYRNESKVKWMATASSLMIPRTPRATPRRWLRATGTATTPAEPW